MEIFELDLFEIGPVGFQGSWEEFVAGEVAESVVERTANEPLHLFVTELRKLEFF